MHGSLFARSALAVLPVKRRCGLQMNVLRRSCRYAIVGKTLALMIPLLQLNYSMIIKLAWIGAKLQPLLE